MNKLIHVPAHTRKAPEKKPDPLCDLIEERRREKMAAILRDQKDRSPRQWWNRRPAWWERLFS